MPWTSNGTRTHRESFMWETSDANISIVLIVCYCQMHWLLLITFQRQRNLQNGNSSSKIKYKLLIKKKKELQTSTISFFILYKVLQHSKVGKQWMKIILFSISPSIVVKAKQRFSFSSSSSVIIKMRLQKCWRFFSLFVKFFFLSTSHSSAEECKVLF